LVFIRAGNNIYI